MYKVLVPKETVTDWNVGHINISALKEVIEGDNKRVYCEDFVMSEDKIFVLHGNNGREEVEIKSGNYKPPYVEGLEKIPVDEAELELEE